MASATQVPPAPPIKFILRSKEVTTLYDGPPDIKVSSSPINAEGSNMFLQSPDGKLVAVRSTADIKVFSMDDGSLVSTIEHSDVIHMAFSPLGTYLQTWRFFHKATEEGVDDNNLRIFDVKTGALVHGWLQKTFFSQAWPAIKFTPDELISARMVKGEVRFFAKVSFATVVRRIKLANVSHFSWAPSSDAYKILVFAAEKKGTPAVASLCEYPNTGQVLVRKTFYNAQTAIVAWNEKSSFALLTTATEVDKTGRSYYGDTGLYLLGIDGTSINLKADMESTGKIYEAAWQPGQDRFLVVYGSMPAKATMFDTKGEPVVHFPTDYRNTAMFSPSGHVVAIAGFGNLQGTLDFWDVKRARKMGTIEAPCSTVCIWSPCSTYLLTATLSPRLRVDNMFKIWRIDGTLLMQQPMDELYQIEWQQLSASLFPNRPPKRGDSAPAKLEKKQEEAAKPAVYRPRHLAGRTAPSLSLGRPKEPQNKAQVVLTSSQLEAERQRKKVPIGGMVKTKAQLKNERRRKKKEEEDAAGGAAAGTANATVPAAKKEEKAAEVPAPAAAADSVTIAQKKVKALEKKLRQLDAIQAKIDAGSSINDAQKKKLAGKADVIADLESAKTALQALEG